MKVLLNEFDFVSVFLRLFSLSGKFLLVLFMAKYLSISNVGEWGLITNFIVFITFIIGSELYTYYTVEINKKDQLFFEKIIHMILFSTLLKIFLFYIFSFFFIEYLKNFFFNYSNIIFILLFLESLSQEIFRVHVALGNIKIANLVLAIRSGIWCYVIVFLWLLEKNITLEHILYIWSVSSCLSIVIGLKTIPSINLLKILDVSTLKIDWFVTSLRKSFPYFISGVGLRGVYLFDKIILLYFTDVETVGIYTFYQTIFFAIGSFIDAGLAAKFYSYFAKLFHKSCSCKEITARVNERLKLAGIFTLILIIASIFVINISLYFINKEIYQNNIFIFYIIVASSLPFVLSQFYQVALNVMGQGKYLLISNYMSAVFFLLVLSLLLSFELGLFGSAIAFVLFTLSMLLSKMYFFYRTIKLLAKSTLND